MHSVYSSFHLHYVSEIYHYCCLWLQINENHLFSSLPSIPLWPFMYTTVSCFHSSLPSFQAISYMEVRRKFVCVKGWVCRIFMLPLKSPHIKETKKRWSCLLVSTSGFPRQPSRCLLRILGISELLQLWAASGISRPCFQVPMVLAQLGLQGFKSQKRPWFPVWECWLLPEKKKKKALLPNHMYSKN